MKEIIDNQLKHNKCFEYCAIVAILLVLVVCVVIVSRFPFGECAKLEGDNLVRITIACIFCAIIVFSCITFLLVRIPSVFDTRNMALLEKLQKLEDTKTVADETMRKKLEEQKQKIDELKKKIGDAQKVEEDKILCNEQVQEFLKARFDDKEHRLSALAFDHFLDREKLLLMATIFGNENPKDNSNNNPE